MTLRNLTSQAEFQLRALNCSQPQAADSNGAIAVMKFNVF